jgi:hypothetical protein
VKQELNRLVFTSGLYVFILNYPYTMIQASTGEILGYKRKSDTVPSYMGSMKRSRQ